MTKGAVIDLILLNVLGGKLSDDANVQRGEVDAYLDIAYAMAAKAVVVESLSLQGASQMGAAFNTVLSPFTGTPTKDSDRDLWRLDLPRVLPVEGNDGVVIVYPQKNPSMPYLRMDNAISYAGASHLGDLMPSFHVESNVVWFHNYPMPVHPVVAMICPSVSAQEDTDELAYPEGITARALQYAEAWFRKQRETMADPTSNDKDLNEAAR